MRHNLGHVVATAAVAARRVQWIGWYWITGTDKI